MDTPLAQVSAHLSGPPRFPATSRPRVAFERARGRTSLSSRLTAAVLCSGDFFSFFFIFYFYSRRSSHARPMAFLPIILP